MQIAGIVFGMLDAKTVLFVCSGNFYRSRFAEAVFNHRALQHGVAWRAESRGFSPHLATSDLAPEARQALELRNIPLALTRRKPARLLHQDLSRAHTVVCVNEIEHRPKLAKSHPEWVNRVLYWDIHDVDVEPSGTALPTLEQNVLDLFQRDCLNQPLPNHHRPLPLALEF